MTTKTSELPDTKFIKSEVIDVIVKKLGITKTAFFLRENMSQRTDYLEIKKKIFEDKTVVELYKEIIRSKINK